VAAGTPKEVLDGGNEGQLLDDFLAHPIAVAAKLTRVHLLAIRLYSCPMHKRINEPLNVGCTYEDPHPYAAVVVTLVEAWQKLRQAAEEKPVLFTKLGCLGIPEVDGKSALWRPFNSAVDIGEYRQRGCLETGFLSAYKMRATAERRALRLGKANMLDKPTILKIKTEHVVDISPFSVFPELGECLLPPCTYLDLRSETTMASQIELGRGETKEVNFRHVESAPTLMALP